MGCPPVVGDECELFLPNKDFDLESLLKFMYDIQQAKKIIPQGVFRGKILAQRDKEHFSTSIFIIPSSLVLSFL